MIVEALSLVPELRVRTDEEHVYIRFGETAQEMEIRLADAVDSLLTVWHDYETLQNTPGNQRDSDR